MIPLIGLNKVLRTGMMQRYKSKTPIVPEISPDIQGLNALNLLDDEQKAMLRYALKNEAKIKGCYPSELRWAFGRRINGVAPLKIWYPKKVTLFDRIRKRILK